MVRSSPVKNGAKSFRFRSCSKKRVARWWSSPGLLTSQRTRRYHRATFERCA